MSKYVITGSIGNISKQIIIGLVAQNKNVVVITSSENRVTEIEQLGANALVGSVLDSDFVNAAFENAALVYTMIPPVWDTTNMRETQRKIAGILAESISKNNVPYVVNLSSVGAHLSSGNGPIGGLYDLEQLLNKIPGLSVKHLRPSSFFYNFLNQIPLIRTAGFMGANYGEGEKLLLVDTKDIAEAALEEILNTDFKGNSVRYIISDERLGKEVADVLGKAIGNSLNWVVFTDEQQLQGLLGAGVPETHAKAFTEMGAGYASEILQEDARKTLPVFGKVKLDDFAKEFVKAFHNEKVDATQV